VAEAEFNRVPAIFVPFPHHRDQHQRRNAAALVTAGAALLARDPMVDHGDDQSLEATIVSVVSDEDRLAAMTERMHARGARNSAAEVARVLRDEADAASRHLKAR
jgi:UDP-N-acetylglucosamine--N-acetylmuramyl-(pentapeptide) pyrophosphoryl-undecaprenol N-acetylglucosamine transferase